MYTSFDGISIKEYQNSKQGHWLASLGIYRGRPMAMGGYSIPDNRDVESTLQTGEWYPLTKVVLGNVEKGFYDYSTVTIEDYLYTFGK